MKTANNLLSGQTFWFTGEEVTIGDPHQPEVTGPLKVYTDGRHRYAHCEKCRKTWDVDTLKEIEPVKPR